MLLDFQLNTLAAQLWNLCETYIFVFSIQRIFHNDMLLATMGVQLSEHSN